MLRSTAHRTKYILINGLFFASLIAAVAGFPFFHDPDGSSREVEGKKVNYMIMSFATHLHCTIVKSSNRRSHR